MAQQFLHHFEFCPNASQQSRVGASECVPSEPLLNSCLLRSGTNISAQDRLAPDWLAAAVTSARKNPIVWFVVTADLFPFAKSLQDGRMNWHRLLGGFGFARSDHADTIDRVTFIVCWAKSISLHFTANSSLWHHRLPQCCDGRQVLGIPLSTQIRISPRLFRRCRCPA